MNKSKIFWSAMIIVLVIGTVLFIKGTIRPSFKDECINFANKINTMNKDSWEDVVPIVHDRECLLCKRNDGMFGFYKLNNCEAYMNG